jgi:tRNA(fMet)-specific endonuclease VapC
VIVFGEYLYGIRQSRLRASYEAWIRENLSFFELLPIVRETAERYSEIRSELKATGTPIPSNDLWIAALARHRRMRLVTRDSHFRGIRGIHTLAW